VAGDLLCALHPCQGFASKVDDGKTFLATKGTKSGKKQQNLFELFVLLCGNPCFKDPFTPKIRRSFRRLYQTQL
jgi:hypothetical protein